jgi:hypothetical protein
MTVDPALIHMITRLSMQRTRPLPVLSREGYKSLPGTMYKGNLRRCGEGKRGYKVTNIQDGTMCLACQLIAGKLIRKNRPMQVTGLDVDLTGKCVEGMQMNWEIYLINELDKDCQEAQDQGYEFHFIWLLILIEFVTCEMSEGETFPEVEPSEPLVARFTTLWYTSNMVKQWQSNVVFHTYYIQLTRAIESFPRMTPNTLHRFRTLTKFHTDDT